MDLYLMDAILKGQVPEKGKVLDVGCGEGRNGIYFINNGYPYHGFDQDASKIQLLKYLSSNLGPDKIILQEVSLGEIDLQEGYDLIIASRVLHFAENKDQFNAHWKKLVASLNPGGVLYFSMDSAIAQEFVTTHKGGKAEFEDGRLSFALTASLYHEMLQALEEIEPLKTTIYQGQRVQSVGLLRKG